MGPLQILVILAAGQAQALAAGDARPVEVLSVKMFLEGGGRSEELTWPMVAGDAGDEAVIAMNSALSWENVTGEPFEETMEIYSRMQRGFVGSDYEINYDDSGILDLTITVDFYGAYPSTMEHYFTFDTETGARLTMTDLMRDDRLTELAALVAERLEENARTAESVWCAGPNGADESMYDVVFDESDLEVFSIEGDGIEFHYDFGFPHAFEAAEPDEDVFLSFDELEPYLDPEGPLGGV